jgi:predicted RNA-binding protein YlqC (UPF0109 family)
MAVPSEGIPESAMTAAEAPQASTDDVETQVPALLAYIAGALVDHPDEVAVEHELSDDAIVLRLHVRQTDIGKVIGKQGRTARAIRNLLQAAANERNLNVQLHFVDA